MRRSKQSVFASLAVAVVLACAPTRAAEPLAAPQGNPDGHAPQGEPDGQAPPAKQAPQAKQDEPAAKTPAEERADLYARLAASKDADETSGIIGRLLHLYAESGSDTGDLLLQRARQAIGIERYDDALKILDQTVALLPDWAEGWNARATARYLADDYNGSMADIAQTLKREPNHLGALMGMAAILEARGKKEDALKVYGRTLAIAPGWRNAEEAADKLKAEIAGSEL
jgi:tetratricopeptide (TPR) repeat protein